MKKIFLFDEGLKEKRKYIEELEATSKHTHSQLFMRLIKNRPFFHIT